jgi:ankyrin repeat protein
LFWRYGNTALHYACEEERLEIARMLLKAGASLEVRYLSGVLLIKVGIFNSNFN